jgi:anti-sigma-K factor RskA
MVHEDYKEMLPQRALSTLDAADRVAVNEHLLVCAECRRELETWEATASLLSLSATPMEPSASVRERILKQVREEHRTQTVENAAASVVPFTSRSRAVSYGLIAAGLVCTLLIGWIAFLSIENRRARIEIARLSEQIKTTEARLTQERGVREILTARGSKLIPLSGTGPMPGAEAMLAYEPKGVTLLIAKNLPAAPAGKGYQLWFIVNNKPLPGKVFNTDASGSGTMRDQMPGGVDNKAIFAITMEDAGGAEFPTSPILLRSGL